MCQEPVWWCVLHAVGCSCGCVIAVYRERGESHSRSRAYQSRHSNQTPGEDVQKLCHVSTSKNYDVSGRFFLYLVGVFSFYFFSLAGEGGQGICGFYFSFVIKFKVDFTGLSPPHIVWWHDCLLILCQMQGVLLHWKLQYIPEASKIHGEIQRSQCTLFHPAAKAVFSLLGQDLLHKITHLWQGAKEKNGFRRMSQETGSLQGWDLRVQSQTQHTISKQLFQICRHLRCPAVVSRSPGKNSRFFSFVTEMTSCLAHWEC